MISGADLVRATVLLLATLNIGLSATKRRAFAIIALESGVYAVWSWLALFNGAPFQGPMPAAVTVLIVVLVAGLVAKTDLSARILRRLSWESKLDWALFGDRFAKRMGLAKARMAERERRAKDLGISVVDVLKLEHAEEKRRRE